jgi:hypothetical protein
MSHTRLSCFWQEPELGREIRAAVSLHGHTNHSKESLLLIPELARKAPMLYEALEKQARRSRIPVDFTRAYWTPPLTPKLAYETEQNQIEKVLGLKSLVSMTDHDNIEAPLSLRMLPVTAQIPISLEWSVPFGTTIFHLGVHNLPGNRAQAMMDELRAHTRNPSDRQLLELLAMLDQLPDVLVVFNHPLWTQSCVGVKRGGEDLERFLRCSVTFLHAFEINATRSKKENDRVGQLAERWQRPLVSGGDRHGCAASGALNLTGAETFNEFVSEIRRDQRSRVLLMPQYMEPVSVRTTRTLLDVIREYPDYPIGSRRWDDRIFHPDENGGADRPISTLWKAPPAYVEKILSYVRRLEHAAVQRTLGFLFKSARTPDCFPHISPVSTEVISTEAVSSEALS